MSEEVRDLFPDVERVSLAIAKRPSKRERVVGAYLIRDTRSGKLYAGSSANVGARMREHRSTIQKGTHANAGMRDLMTGRGIDELEVQIIECVGREEAFRKEQALFDHYAASGLLLNRAKDAKNNRSFDWTEDEKRAQSNRLKGRIKTPETCNKLSQALTGRVLTQEHCENLSTVKRQMAAQGRVPQLSAQAMRCRKSVSVDGRDFESATQAAAHFGLKETTMLYRLSSTSAQFQNWFYKENNE